MSDETRRIDGLLRRIQASQGDYEKSASEIRRSLDGDDRFPATSLVRERWKDTARTAEKLSTTSLSPDAAIGEIATAVTDLMGIRYVGLLYSDKYDIAEAIMNAARRKKLVIQRQNPTETTLRQMTAEERTRPLPDEIRADGYSSIHFVVLPQGDEMEHRLKPRPVEIQVRTIFEEAFAEVSHVHAYEYARAGIVIDPRAAALLQVLSELLRPAARVAGVLAGMAVVEQEPGTVNLDGAVARSPASKSLKSGKQIDATGTGTGGGPAGETLIEYVERRLGHRPSQNVIGRFAQTLGLHGAAALAGVPAFVDSGWDAGVRELRKMLARGAEREPFTGGPQFDDQVYCLLVYLVRHEHDRLGKAVVRTEIRQLIRQRDLS